MSCSSHLHNFSLLHWLTFVLAFDFRIHALSTATAAEQAMTTDFLFDALNLTGTTFAELEDTPFYSSSLVTEYDGGSTSILTTTTTSRTTPGVHDNKPSITMSSRVPGGGMSSSSSSSSSSTSSTLSVSSASTSASSSSSSRSTTAMRSQSSTSSSSTTSLNGKLFKSTKRNSFEAKSLRSLRTDSSSGTFPTAEGDRQRTFRSKHHHEHHWGPFFEEPHNATLSGDNLVSTAHLFTEAVLNCRVGMLKDKTVMWVRKTTEKVSLLTVGNVTYSGDPRIRVKFQYPNNWRLLINPTQREDAGIYMCQVSTHPPRVFTTNLTILEPPLRLIDDQERDVGDRYYKAGSTIDLQCQVSKSFLIKEQQSIMKSMQTAGNNQTKFNMNIKSSLAAAAATAAGGGVGVGGNTIAAPANALIMSANQTGKQGQSYEKQFSNFIYWAKDDEPLPSTAIKRFSATDKWLNSRVSIPDANLLDTGNYSCSIAKVFTAIVQVQVLSGELPAAVQHNAATTSFYWQNYKRLNFCLLAVTFILRNISLLAIQKSKYTISLTFKLI